MIPVYRTLTQGERGSYWKAVFFIFVGIFLGGALAGAWRFWLWGRGRRWCRRGFGWLRGLPREEAGDGGLGALLRRLTAFRRHWTVGRGDDGRRCSASGESWRRVGATATRDLAPSRCHVSAAYCAYLSRRRLSFWHRTPDHGLRQHQPRLNRHSLGSPVFIRPPVVRARHEQNGRRTRNAARRLALSLEQVFTIKN